jgi:hypothetical protein
MPSKPVMKGMGLLDQVRPGWWKNVDLADFNLADTESCVLACAFPECSYNETVENLSGLKAPDVPMVLGIHSDIWKDNPEWAKFLEDVVNWEKDHGFSGDRVTERVWKDMIRFRQMHPDMAMTS